MNLAAMSMRATVASTDNTRVACVQRRGLLESPRGHIASQLTVAPSRSRSFQSSTATVHCAAAPRSAMPGLAAL